MALIECEECGNEVSDQAESCPECGAPINDDQDDGEDEWGTKEKVGCGGCLGFIAIIIIAIIGGIQSADIDVPAGPGSATIGTMCEQFISDRLTAPSTAEFQGTSDERVSVISSDDGSDTVYRYTGYVDAENKMGAKIRKDFICEVRYLGDEEWRLVDLTFTE